jgi:hypothetical protein
LNGCSYQCFDFVSELNYTMLEPFKRVDLAQQQLISRAINEVSWQEKERLSMSRVTRFRPGGFQAMIGPRHLSASGGKQPYLIFRYWLS